jgi:hypothetical protein
MHSAECENKKSRPRKIWILFSLILHYMDYNNKVSEGTPQGGNPNVQDIAKE